MGHGTRVNSRCEALRNLRSWDSLRAGVSMSGWFLMEGNVPVFSEVWEQVVDVEEAGVER